MKYEPGIELLKMLFILNIHIHRFIYTSHLSFSNARKDQSLHSWHPKDKRERENKTKSSRKQQNQNLHQIIKKPQTKQK